MHDIVIYSRYRLGYHALYKLWHAKQVYGNLQKAPGQKVELGVI